MGMIGIIGWIGVIASTGFARVLGSQGLQGLWNYGLGRENAEWRSGVQSSGQNSSDEGNPSTYNPEIVLNRKFLTNP